MKTNFCKVVFTEKGEFMLDEPGGWSNGWVLQDVETPAHVIKKRQQGRGIMMWAGIYSDILNDCCKAYQSDLLCILDKTCIL